MRYVFHIGMGKTGTTSIQRALAAGAPELERRGARYLGMWFGLAGSDCDGAAGLHALFRLDAGAQRDRARRFHRASVAAGPEGISTLILSNEAVFGHIERARPFFETLGGLAETRFLLYLRPPHDWLPSAYVQWGIRHKVRPGPVPSFAGRARTLIGQYEKVRLWHRAFGDRLQVRRHDPAADVVADFAAALGLDLAAPASRLLPRPEPAETLFRALFNDRFDDPVRPERFERLVLDPGRDGVRETAAMIRRCFDMAELDAIVAEQAETFAYIRSAFGLDLTAGAQAPAPAPDEAAIRDRLVDYLVETVIQQGLRIGRLERALAGEREV